MAAVTENSMDAATVAVLAEGDGTEGFSGRKTLYSRLAHDEFSYTQWQIMADPLATIRSLKLNYLL